MIKPKSVIQMRVHMYVWWLNLTVLELNVWASNCFCSPSTELEFTPLIHYSTWLNAKFKGNCDVTCNIKYGESCQFLSNRYGFYNFACKLMFINPYLLWVHISVSDQFYFTSKYLTTVYLCHKWPRIWSTCCIQFPVLSSFMTYHRVST